MLRILSACALLESAEGINNVSNSSPMSPEALGQNQESSWQVWLRGLVAIGFALMGIAYLMSVGAIRFGGGNVDHEDQGGPNPGVNEVPVQDDADGEIEEITETASDRWYRYKNDSISECSDPEHWMAINHVVLSSSESEEQQHDELASTVIEAFDRCVDTVDESVLISWLMSRCQRRRDEATDDDKREVYNDHVIALSTSWMDMCDNNAVPTHFTPFFDNDGKVGAHLVDRSISTPIQRFSLCHFFKTIKD